MVEVAERVTAVAVAEDEKPQPSSDDTPARVGVIRVLTLQGEFKLIQVLTVGQNVVRRRHSSLFSKPIAIKALPKKVNT